MLACNTTVQPRTALESFIRCLSSFLLNPDHPYLCLAFGGSAKAKMPGRSNIVCDGITLNEDGEFDVRGLPRDSRTEATWLQVLGVLKIIDKHPVLISPHWSNILYFTVSTFQQRILLFVPHIRARLEPYAGKGQVQGDARVPMDKLNEARIIMK